MACVLLGWELGANRGHITSLLPIANRLLTEGHEVHLALQLIDAPGLALDRRIRLWQAPVWPRLIASLALTATTPAATMGDILARLGLDRPGGLSALIAGWESLIAAIRPDFVLADFAPALLATVKGRIACAKIGIGFACPPANLERFPSWHGMKASSDEDELLDIVDAELAISGRAPLASLPALFSADTDIVISFAEFDPYAVWRQGGYALPTTTWLAAQAGGQGEEIFGYFSNQLSAELALWDGLAASGRTVRLHVHDPSPELLARFRALRFRFEPRPLAFARIAAQSRIAVSQGGHGFVSSCALTGLPQMIAPFDLEKYLCGRAVRDAGLGLDHALFDLDPAAFGALLAEMCVDEGLHDRCWAKAAELSARPLPRAEDLVAGLVAASR